MKDYRDLSQCVACGGTNLKMYLDLGDQPLANSCHNGSAFQPSFPLGAQVCTDCWHSQLPVAVNPDLLFKNYLYVSGTTKTLTKYFEWFVDKIESDVGAQPLQVLDIASNDGSLLKQFKARGHIVQGVDPAANLQALSRANGVPTIVDYWSEKVVDSLKTRFDVIVAMNVVAHVADPLSFLRSCKRALKEDGRLYIQTSQALMIKNGEFDTIYHEHHSFFNVGSMMALTRRAGLRLQRVEHVPVHGQSYLFEIRVGAKEEASVEDFDLGKKEESWGYYNLDTYIDFARRAELIRKRVGELVAWHRAAGYQIVGYGVAAKGMTFLNYARIDLDYIVDDNPLKVGLLTPGRNIPIVGPERLELEREPILYLILAWNFFDEIVRRIRDRKRDPRDAYLTYFPQLTLTQETDVRSAHG